MRLIAISGSARKGSTNTTLLRAIKVRSQGDFEIEILNTIDQLPIFNQDLEGDKTKK